MSQDKRTISPKVCVVKIENLNTLSVLPAGTGAIFGNPAGSPRQKVMLTSVTQSQILAIERTSTSPEKMAIALLHLLFSNSELARGNCTKPVREDIRQLDTERLWAIRCE